MFKESDIFVKEFMPAFKARCAKIMYKKYNLKQKDIAKFLEITQPAVNKYLNEKYSNVVKIREKNIDDKNIVNFIENILKNDDIGAQKYVCIECSKTRKTECPLMIK
jgi:predicted transcriptional regulator